MHGFLIGPILFSLLCISIIWIFALKWRMKWLLTKVLLQFAALLNNTSLAVKSICLIMFCGYFLSFSDQAILALSVTPGYFNPPHFWFWTALTHCFLEIHFWEVNYWQKYISFGIRLLSWINNCQICSLILTKKNLGRAHHRG